MTVVTSATELTVQTFEVTKEETIAAPIEIVYETLLEQLGPSFEPGEGMSLHMVLEAWPGGRWFRDLGDKKGHLWGHVQVIKPPALLEIAGPMMMSYPAISHVQCRLTADGDVTRLKFVHRGMGYAPAHPEEGLNQGWARVFTRVREAAERRTRTPGASR
ncbi:MAG: SRPBCC family protein [bacterium]